MKIKYILFTCLFAFVANANAENAKVLPENWYGQYHLINEAVVGKIQVFKCEPNLNISHDYYEGQRARYFNITGSVVEFSFNSTKNFIYSKVNKGVESNSLLMVTQKTKSIFKNNVLTRYLKTCVTGSCWATSYEIDDEIKLLEDETLSFTNHGAEYSDTPGIAKTTCIYQKVSN